VAKQQSDDQATIDTLIVGGGPAGLRAKRISAATGAVLCSWTKAKAARRLSRRAIIIPVTQAWPDTAATGQEQFSTHAQSTSCPVR
jgi:succinate dehydrogenase/fumarate reductase flavoprotein subunit